MSYDELRKALKTKCPVCGRENEAKFICQENSDDGVLLSVEYECFKNCLDKSGCGAVYYFEASVEAVKEHLLPKEEAET